MPTIADLLTEYRDRTGASYMDMSRKVRDEILANRLHQLHTRPPKGFPEARTVELLAELLELPVSTIVLSIAASLGIPVRDSAPALARSLPPDTDSLTDRDRDAVLAVVRQLVDARRPGAGAELVDLARPPQPDLSRVAARRGKSEGRRLREQQDQQTDD